MPQTTAVVWHFLAARRRWASLNHNNLAAYQEKRLLSIVAYAQIRSPFYQNHWRGHDPADWHSLPPVNKSLMMANFGQFNTRGIGLEAALRVALQAEVSRDFEPKINGLTVGLSSGTSGHRGLFLISPAEQAAWAGVILARTLHHIPWREFSSGGLRVAFFLRSSSNLYQQTASKAIRFRYFDLAAPVDQSAAELNRFQPHILLAPPRMLSLLASQQSACGLHIAPQRVFSIADVLEASDRLQVETAFHQPVEQIYQCTEGLLAVSCAAGSLHVQEDLVKIEWQPLEDSAGASPRRRFMPIVTDLWRKTQPIIRYRLNDVIRLADQPCACGSPFQVIEAIEGRCDDILFFPALDGNPPVVHLVFPDTIRRAVLLAEADLNDYLCVQERRGHLRIHLDAANFPAAAQAVRRSALAALEAQGCSVDHLEIVPAVPALPPDAKRRRVQCLYSSDQENLP